MHEICVLSLRGKEGLRASLQGQAFPAPFVAILLLR